VKLIDNIKSSIIVVRTDAGDEMIYMFKFPGIPSNDMRRLYTLTFCSPRNQYPSEFSKIFSNIALVSMCKNYLDYFPMKDGPYWFFVLRKNTQKAILTEPVRGRKYICDLIEKITPKINVLLRNEDIEPLTRNCVADIAEAGELWRVNVRYM